jgi:hypothetical protein
MDDVFLIQPGQLGWNFIPREFLPLGEDEYYHRNRQVIAPPEGWRHLLPDEVERMVMNGNHADSWDNVLVSTDFDARLIQNSRFFGLVRIGRLRNIVLQHHDLKVPAGITNSLIISSDIGDDAAIHDVHYLSHYIIGERCILFNIHEMNTTDHAKFGNGILKEGEPENIRTWLDLMNEGGARKVLPFDGMLAADAYLWAKYRDDQPLQDAFVDMTQHSFDHRRGYYGSIGDQCVIKNSLILKDVKIGSHCYIKGANKLKNLTINSSSAEPTQIGEGVELVNGIIGFGCHIFYGCKAVKFIMGNNSSLKYGGRLINSFLGDNSTISCCEVLYNLIFPAHEQHHNNSFLIAALVMGQSNIAAGATLGSNHNSRANDLEIQAGRGFWPALCTSVKFSSRFASFTLLLKADYPFELDIRLPFSMVTNNASQNRLEILPAYWWNYNMYALVRNAWKYILRDTRISKVQHIEFDFLAPDTAEEILNARHLLEIWIARAVIAKENSSSVPENTTELALMGRNLLRSGQKHHSTLEVLGEQMENSDRKCLIIKPFQAYKAYENMLLFYAVKQLIHFWQSKKNCNLALMVNELKSQHVCEWINLGGQLVQKDDLDHLREEIRNGKMNTWHDLHSRYDALWDKYTLDKQKHAMACLCKLYEVPELTAGIWKDSLQKALAIHQNVADAVYATRKKDFDNPFRKLTFENSKEMHSVLGKPEDDDVVKRIREETHAICDFIARNLMD